MRSEYPTPKNSFENQASALVARANKPNKVRFSDRLVYESDSLHNWSPCDCSPPLANLRKVKHKASERPATGSDTWQPKACGKQKTAYEKREQERRARRANRVFASTVQSLVSVSQAYRSQFDIN